MHISSLEEYGLRCALQLARHYGGKPMPASRIAEIEKISVEYVSKFMHLLRKSGLITAVRGVQGGFVLSKAPQQITLKDVFDALKEKKAPMIEGGTSFCAKFSGQQNSCVHLDQCSIRPFWKMIDVYFEAITREITLDALLIDEVHVSKKIETLAIEQAAALRKFSESSVANREGLCLQQ